MVGSPPKTFPPGTPGDGHSIRVKRIRALRALDGSDAETAEHQKRLEADGDLFDRLMLGGFEGPEFERFRTELAAYALGVLTPWIRTGRIVQRCVDYGGRCPELVDRARSDEASTDIAVETVAKALIYFRNRVLAKGKWNRVDGATLRTFFIGACIFCFRNAYRDWRRLDLRTRPSRPSPFDPPLLELVDERPSQDPERRVGARRRLDRLLRTVGDETRTAVVMDAAGSTYEEIAAELGSTVRAVDSRLYRFRQRR
jgi:DNA-directed RNA polymerase specialized sigma24 family protein